MRRIACLVAAAAVGATAAAAAARADLVSHRAFYNMELESTTRASDVAELDGRMALEVAEGCDGWTLDQRIALTIVNHQGDEINSYTTFTSWESKDGRRFRFEQQIRQDGVTVDELSGRATLDAEGRGVAKLTKPETMEIPLPPGTLFPNEHTELLLARAAAGDNFIVRIVFDGTSVDNPNRVSAFIGKAERLPPLAADLGEQRAWPIRLAFFPLDRRTPEPEVEIGLMMQADGVVRTVELDYGNFAISGKLNRFEPIAPLPC